MHFCGRGEYFIDSLCGHDGIYGVHMSQPLRNDMEKILEAVQKHHKRIVFIPNAPSYVKNIGTYGSFVGG